MAGAAENKSSCGISLKDGNGDPPELDINLPKLCDLPATAKHPSLPIDILLLTVKDCEFLGCHAHLRNSFRWYFDSLGYVYFGNACDDENVKVALMRCSEGSTSPGSSLITVKNAVTVLRPKAVISVGCCSGLNHEKTKLGDVVVSAKLTTYASKEVVDGQEQSIGTRSLVSRRFLQLIRHVADGWKAPLKIPEVRDVKIHNNGKFLSGPEKISADWRRKELVQLHPQATAIEMEGEGLFSAAFDDGIEWLLVKGIADFADGNESVTWGSFASVMAASVVFNFLSDPIVLRTWPHYQDAFDPAELIDGIRQLYKVREGWLAPFPWLKELFRLDDLFTRLKMVSRKKTRGTVTSNIVSMSDIFIPHEECPHQPRTVLIEGKPGMGKTTCCKKLVYDWATGKQEAEGRFPRFETVLLLKCRDITESADLWEAIDDQLLPRDVEEDVKQSFFNFIRHKQSNVLLVLDGLDEVPDSKLPMFSEIIEGRVLQNCRLVATARHEAGIKVREHCDTLLEIEGFTGEDAERFIVKYFNTREDSGEDLSKKLLYKLRHDRNLKEMAANPLNTALLCLVCEEFQGIFPENRTKLYLEIIECILRRYRRNKGLSEDSEDLIEVYKAPLRHLGWIALNGLLEGERTHQIPVEGLAKKDDTYRKIWLDLLRFVNPEQTAIFPPVYCRISETKQTEYCLQWLARKAEMPNKLKKVYELEGLVCDLHSHFTAGSGSTMGISKSKATELISSTIFDYEPNSRCDWHEKQEVKFCAVGTVLRYCYCMSDFLCSVYGIPLTPNHLPERPEGIFCTVIKPADSSSWSSQEDTQPRGMRRPVQDNGPFASRDYRYYNGGASDQGPSSSNRPGGGAYTRSGPTYDQQSLYSSQEDDDIEYNSRAQAPPQAAAWQLPQRSSQPQQPMSGFGVGRGRGRGGSNQPIQPLRRPNLPGMAAGSASASQDTSWSSIAATDQSSASVDSIPAWARTVPQPRGRGALRAPATRPKVYAGAMNPPAPTHAPMPPSAWQRQAWQGAGGVASHMNSLDLNG